MRADLNQRGWHRREPIVLAFNQPTMIELGNGYFELAEPLRFRLRMGVGEIMVTVPAGFTTDFASVPRILWPIFPPYGTHSKAAVLHDFLYSVDGDCSRFLADALFREAMMLSGTSWWRATAMYYAVRLFGYGFRRKK